MKLFGIRFFQFEFSKVLAYSNLSSKVFDSFNFEQSKVLIPQFGLFEFELFGIYSFEFECSKVFTLFHLAGMN